MYDIGNWLRTSAAVACIVTYMVTSPAGATVLYSTGFEQPTFTTGAIDGQDGWTEFPGSGASFVQNNPAFVFSGTQSAVVIPALATGQDGPFKAVNTSAPIVTQSAEIYLASSSTQSGWQYAATGAGLVGFAGGIDIDPDGTIHAITAAFPTIGTFSRDTWNEVDLILDYSTQTYTIDLNGVAIDSNVAFCGDNGPCTGETVASYSDGFFDAFPIFDSNNNNISNDLGALDDYSVSTPTAAVPEPASFTLLAASLVAFGLIGRLRRNSGSRFHSRTTVVS